MEAWSVRESCDAIVIEQMEARLQFKHWDRLQSDARSAASLNLEAFPDSDRENFSYEGKL